MNTVEPPHPARSRVATRRTLAFVLVCFAQLLSGSISSMDAADTPTFSDDDFANVRGALAAALAHGAFPGCSYAIGSSRRVHSIGGVGHFAYDAKTTKTLGLATNPNCTKKTLYDLASLTKVIGTTTVTLALIRDRKIGLRDPISRWLPEFVKNDSGEVDERRTKVNVEHLLVHASGLPAWKAFYRSAKSYRETIELALATPLETDPGTRYRYSDVGFILLGELASRAGRAPLSELEKKLVFAPLGIDDLLRSPAKSKHARIPPTELDPATKELVHGIVHDENCRGAEGATGHAGLFGSAEAISILAREYLRALRGESKILPRELTRTFVRRRELVPGSSRALGWDTPSGLSSGGDYISPSSFGHTGFTGTSIWIDPSRDLYFLLLTNRVHPTRKNRKISAVRRGFAHAVVTAIEPDAKPVDRNSEEN